MNVDNSVKQVIVLRKDLKMPKGKLVSQGAHSSLMFITKLMENEGVVAWKYFPKVVEHWAKNGHTKVVLSCDSEEELISLYDKAKEAGIIVNMVTDAGLTVFNGVHTKTCIAIGPDESEKINLITGHLKPYQ